MPFYTRISKLTQTYQIEEESKRVVDYIEKKTKTGCYIFVDGVHTT